MALVKTSYNRRSFLKVSATTGGGFLLGFSWLTSCTPTPEQILEMPENWFDINAFLKIGNNGLVTIFSPNPEIGQNVKTSMPMLVAEELDVDWKNVVVEQAGLDTKKYKRQLAGGSQSIRQGWESLRMAGATARQMLIAAAALKLEVSTDELSTKEGSVIHEDSGRSLGYGELALDAVNVEVPAEVELKDPANFTIIGVGKKNVDGKKIVTGEPLFGLDIDREGMLIAMIVHPPAFGLKLKSIDDTAARNMPGVKDIFEIEVYPEGIEKTWSDRTAYSDLIAVVGNSTWEVMNAKKALKVEWEVSEELESTVDHEERLAELVSQKQTEFGRVDGDPDSAFERAKKIVEASYEAPFLAHNTLEPMNFFADVKADSAELIGPIQTPENMHKTVSSVLGLDPGKVSIMMSRMGGGFGRRLYGHFVIEAALISQRMKAPVKLVYSREDDMTQGIYRPAYKVNYKAGLDENNNLIAFQVIGAGTHGGPVYANRFPAGTVEHYRATSLQKNSNISTGAWRAPRSNFIAGAEQSFLDEVAESAGKDPIEFRLQLFERAQKNPIGERNDYDADRYAGVLKLVKEKSGWGKEEEGVFRGVSAYYCHNSYVAQVLDLVMKDGFPKVKKVWCAVDCGIVVNPEGARNQVEGGIVDGIGHAMFSSMTFTEGKPDHKNFDSYRLIRHSEAPEEIQIDFVDNGIDPTGLGEPSLPPIMGALANAMYKATGRRVYKQPFIQLVEVLG